MLSDSPHPDRDKVFMSDRSYRVLPQVEQIGDHLQLEVRSFPDRSRRMSFSLRGVWAIGFSTIEFLDWARSAVARLEARPEPRFFASEDKKDIYVDASEFLALEDNFSGRRMRAALALVNEAVVKEAVASGIRAELVALFSIDDIEVRVQRIRDLCGVEVAAGLAGAGPEVASPAGEEVVQTESFVVVESKHQTGGGGVAREDRDDVGPEGVDIEPPGGDEVSVISVPFTEFRFNKHGFRTAVQDGEGWFVRSDVCGALGIANSRSVSSRLEDDEKGVGFIDTLGGRQKVALVNESGLYSLIFGSNKTGARIFRRWVTSEVLPTIRKTGGYQGRGRLPHSGEVARSEPRYAWRPREVLDSTFYAPEGPDFGLRMDTLPMTLLDFLVFSRIPKPYAETIAPGLEQQICGDSLYERLRNGVSRHPVDGRIFFARAVLDAWWLSNAFDIIKQSKENTFWVFSRGINLPQ